MNQNQAEFRFHAELNDFLPPTSRHQTITYQFKDNPAIKDSIESLGIPHPEVDVILVNDKSVDFSYLVQNGDNCQIFPVSQSPQPPLPLRPPPPHRFILDLHLGKLAGYLRMLGFDTLYRNDYHDEELARVSSSENRILLTRDIGLLKRGIVTHGYWVRATEPEQQIAEILRRFNLFDAVKPFRHCLHCNGTLTRVDKETIGHLLPPKTLEYYDQFHRCVSCGKIYWKGSHYQKMQDFINQILGRQ
ncbi:MAG: Mut7-C RNAse domain-containing protein [Oscillatoriaceae cyanobacterium]